MPGYVLPSWLKKDKDEGTTGYEKYNLENRSNFNESRLAPSAPFPLINPFEVRKNLNFKPADNGIDLTPIDVGKLSKQKDYTIDEWNNLGPFEKIKAGIEQKKLGNYDYAPREDLYKQDVNKQANSKLGAGIAGFVNAASLGSLEAGAKAQTKDFELPNVFTESETQSPVSYNVGKIAGYVAPSLVGANLASPATNLIKKPLAKQVAEGAIVGTTMTGIEDAFQGKSLKETGKDIVLNAALGAGIDVALHGAGKLAKSAFPGWKTTFESTASNPMKEAAAINQGLSINLQQFNTGKEQPKEVSKFYSNSLKNTQILPDNVKNMLNEADFMYGVKTNQGELNKAQQRLNVRGIQFEMDRLKKSTSYDNAEDAMAHLLITRNLRDEAQSTGDYTKVVDWLKDTRKKTTNTAQSLQALSAWKKTTPEGALIKAQNVVDQVQDDLKKTNPKLIDKVEKEVKQQKELTPLENIEKIREKIYKENNIPTLTPEDAKFITETMTKVQGMKEGYDKNAQIAKVMQLIADKVPATASEKLQAYLRMSMLTNIKTLLVRNPLGNISLGIAENIKDIPASLIDRTVSFKTGKRTTIAPSLKGLKEQGSGLLKGAKEWNMDRKLGVDTSPTKGQYELPNKRIFKNKALNAIDQFTRRSLSLGDRPFYQAAYNERIRQLQIINKTKDITEDMIEDATNFALDRTLQNNSTLAQGAKKIKQGLNLNKDFGLGSIAMPFTGTPANVLDKALDYSPIGTLKAAREWINFTKTGALNQKKLVDELGRSITGTSAIILGWELAKNGFATGKGSTNEKERELNKATGVNDYAFKIGDKYKTFDWMQPMSLPLAMGIDMYNTYKTKGELKNALTSAGDTVFKQSFLQGISRMFGGYSPTSGVLNTASSAYTQAIPSTLRQFTQLADPYQRETYSDNPKEQTLNTLKARVPFISKTLPAKVDVLGNESKQLDGKNNLFNVLINPGYSNTDKNTKGTNMVRDIVEATGNKDILPKVAKPEITYIKEVKNAGTKYREEITDKIKLTPKELSDFKRYIGQETLKVYEEKANSDSFVAKSAKDKAKELESLLRKIYDKGEEEILKSRNIRFY